MTPRALACRVLTPGRGRGSRASRAHRQRVIVDASRSAPRRRPRTLPSTSPLLGQWRSRFTRRDVGRATARTRDGGLSDLRLFDAGGREVPYLLVHRAVGTCDMARRPRAADRGDARRRAGSRSISAARAGRSLTVDGMPAPFLKRLTLEGSGDRARWTLLVAKATLFDLPDGAAAPDRGSRSRPATIRYLRVTWNDTNSGRRAAAARRVAPAAPPTSRVPPTPLIDGAVRAPPERAGPQPLPHSAAGGARLPLVALDAATSAAATSSATRPVMRVALQRRRGRPGELGTRHAGARRCSDGVDAPAICALPIDAAARAGDRAHDRGRQQPAAGVAARRARVRRAARGSTSRRRRAR